MKYIDNPPKYGSIDFRVHKDLEIKFQQEFTKQLSLYPCFNIIPRDNVMNNIFDATTRFKGMVFKSFDEEYLKSTQIESDILEVTSTFTRFMLKTIARGYDLMQSEYAESGYIKVPSTFKLENYTEVNTDVNSPMALAIFYSQLKDITIHVKVPDMVIEWDYNKISQRYEIVYGFRIGLKVLEETK